MRGSAGPPTCMREGSKIGPTVLLPERLVDLSHSGPRCLFLGWLVNCLLNPFFVVLWVRDTISIILLEYNQLIYARGRSQSASMFENHTKHLLERVLSGVNDLCNFP